MSPREEIAHLYRKLGFGVTQDELDRGELLGLDGAMHRLLDYRATDEEFDVHPYEFAWRSNGEADPSAGSYRMWWAMRMIAGQRPAQEHLTLFWHGHFAVSDGKVEDGPMMLQYLDTLRNHADGKFVDLLKAVSKDPAMMRYLDLQRSLVGNPNENFAREVMELFTLGIGNYTEKDVKEAARAFTGWSYVNMYYEFPGNNTQKLKDSLLFKRPFSAFALMPAMHDSAPKTILGETDFFDGDRFLEKLAAHRKTAEHLCTKLWKFYCYDDPEPELIVRLADEWQKCDGDMKHMLFTIARSPEFWSDKCVRSRVKSPADLFIGVARQMGAGKGLMALRGPGNMHAPVRQDVMNNLYGILDRMEKCGLSLLYPKDVSGWKGGKDWISPAAMLERFRYQGTLLYGSHGPDVGAKHTLELAKAQKPANSDEIAQALCAIFDVPLTPTGVAVVKRLVDKHGGMKVLDKLDSWAGLVSRTIVVMMAAPQMQMC